ncbi:unnamed protein product [Fusarium graminearum]|uniref:JmjC domain-containing protein n=1 Tax=Gibberella zeae TaxID=5518 RepID=A0A9N8WXM7_GIBZA|nr:unnamed protein product [Fusarium graminearum]
MSEIAAEAWKQWIDSNCTSPCPKCGVKGIKGAIKHVRKCARKGISEMRENKHPFVPCYFHEEPTNCSQPNISRCRDTALKSYLQKLTGIVAELKKSLPEKIRRSQPGTGHREDLEMLLGYLTVAKIGTPITKRQYRLKNREKRPGEFVFCSQKEAEELVTQGPPTMPIVIPPGPMTSEERSEYAEYQKELVQQVGTQDRVDVYDSGANIANGRKTVKMAVQEAIARVNDDKKPPINMLNNPMPPAEVTRDWMAKTFGCDMTDRVAGLAKEEEGLDLTDFMQSMKIRLDSSTGAVTLLHVDKDGVTTVIVCPVGIKLWFISSVRAEEEELRDFARTATCSDDIFVLLVDEGCQFIQPPSTIHAVYTHCRSVQFCYESYDSRTFARSLNQTRVDLELKDNRVANEVSHKDMSGFFRLCMKICEKDMRMNRPRRWSDMKDIEQAMEDLRSKDEESSCGKIYAGRWKRRKSLKEAPAEKTG